MTKLEIVAIIAAQTLPNAVMFAVTARWVRAGIWRDRAAIAALPASHPTPPARQ